MSGLINYKLGRKSHKNRYEAVVTGLRGESQGRISWLKPEEIGLLRKKTYSGILKTKEESE